MSAADAPEWLQALLTQQNQQIQALSAAQTNTLARLEERLTSVEENRQRTPPPLHAPAPAETSLNTTTVVRKPKPCLPHPEKFDGADLSFFPQFEGLLRAKLEIDGNAIGQEKEKVWYAFGRLSGEAAVRIFPWMSYAERESKFTVNDFIEQLRTAFRDPRQQQKALGQINRTKQGSRPFGEFLNEFNRLILEAEGWGWDDVIKKGYLKAALSTKLLSATIGVQEVPSYDGYCQQLRMINDQLNEVAELTAWRTKRQRGLVPSTAQTTTTTTAVSSYDAMDWQPTTAASSIRRKEGRWASDEVIDERRRSGLCLRCGLAGHRVKDCSTKLRPAKEKIRAAAARNDDALLRDKRSYEDASDSGESGKE